VTEFTHASGRGRRPAPDHRAADQPWHSNLPLR